MKALVATFRKLYYLEEEFQWVGVGAKGEQRGKSRIPCSGQVSVLSPSRNDFLTTFWPRPCAFRFCSFVLG